MRIYHDWEFLEQNNSIYPISVGMVREDGEELYYEFLNTPWNKILKHPWLVHNVIPLLSSGWSAAVSTGQANNVVKSTLSIRMKIHDFFINAHNADPHKGIELWGWYSSYDHVCLGQLFGTMVNLPSFVPMWTNDLRQEVHRLGNLKIPNFTLAGESAHNALDDARQERRKHQWLIDYEKTITYTSNSRGIQYGNGNSQINTF